MEEAVASFMDQWGMPVIAAVAPAIIGMIKTLLPQIKERIPLIMRPIVWPIISAIFGSIIGMLSGLNPVSAAIAGAAGSTVRNMVGRKITTDAV